MPRDGKAPRRIGGDVFIDPEYQADLADVWTCCACGEKNSRLDGECQYCECQGAICKRDNCSGDFHPGPEFRS